MARRAGSVGFERFQRRSNDRRKTGGDSLFDHASNLRQKYMPLLGIEGADLLDVFGDWRISEVCGGARRHAI